MIVLDTNAALSIIKGTPEGDAFQGLMLENERILAPELYYAEAGNAIWQYQRRGDIALQEALSWLNRVIQLVDEYVPSSELLAETLREATHLDHSPYDIFYLVLARRYGATLFTLDKKLMRLCEETGVDYVVEVDF